MWPVRSTFVFAASVTVRGTWMVWIVELFLGNIRHSVERIWRFRIRNGALRRLPALPVRMALYLSEYLLGLDLHRPPVSSAGRPRSTPRGSITSMKIRTAGNVPFLLHYGDMTDFDQSDPPDAADPADRNLQSRRPKHVGVSFESPEYTANADAIGVLRLLEAVRILGMEKETRFYQASTSELYGLVQEVPQKETNAVLSALALCGGETLRLLDHGQLSRGLWHVCLERNPVQPRKPIRGETFVTRKITRSVAGSRPVWKTRCISEISRPSATWGHAKDYVEGMHKILQADAPDDFVLATGETPLGA